MVRSELRIELDTFFINHDGLRREVVESELYCAVLYLGHGLGTIVQTFTFYLQC